MLERRSRAESKWGSGLSWVKVADGDDVVPGRGLRVCLKGIPVGLYRVGNDYYAMEDDCPHAGTPLSKGELVGTVIHCPSHGWDYDVRNGYKPGLTDGFPIPCFPVRIEDGSVWIDIRLPEDDDGD